MKKIIIFIIISGVALMGSVSLASTLAGGQQSQKGKINLCLEASKDKAGSEKANAILKCMKP